VKKGAEKTRVSPLAGTERAFFEGRREELRAGYEAAVQETVDAWEASAAAVASLRLKRFRNVRLATFFGPVALRCREGTGRTGVEVPRPRAPRSQAEPALLAGHGEAHGRSRSRDGQLRESLPRRGRRGVVRRQRRRGALNGHTLGAAAVPPDGPCAGAASRRTRSSSGGRWKRRTGEAWGVNKKNRKLPERVTGTRSARPPLRLSALLAVSGKRKPSWKNTSWPFRRTLPIRFGTLLPREAVRMGLRRRRRLLRLGRRRLAVEHLQGRFEKCSKAMLDFYHLSQHLHALGAAPPRCGHREGRGVVRENPA
jgi:hypothetical protein